MRDVREDVNDHQRAPDDEAQRVDGTKHAAAVAKDKQGNSTAEQRQRRADQQRGKQPEQEPRRPFQRAASFRLPVGPGGEVVPVDDVLIAKTICR